MIFSILASNFGLKVDLRAPFSAKLFSLSLAVQVLSPKMPSLPKDLRIV